MPGTVGTKNTVEAVAPPYAPTNISGCLSLGCAHNGAPVSSSSNRSLLPVDSDICILVSAMFIGGE